MIEQKLTVRHYEPEDYPAMADLANAANHADGSEGTLRPEELAAFFSAPDFDRENDSFILERAGILVGMIDLEFSAGSGRSWADGIVDPKHLHQGIGTELIRLTEARTLARAETELTADQPLSIQRMVSANNMAAIHLFEAKGYSLLRSYYRMRIDFDPPIEAPPLPAGLELRPFDPERHAEAVYEAHQDTFADHWGYERGTYENWAHSNLHAAEIDTSLWQIAWDGDQIAGICLNRPRQESAWVATLGVRREWRKRGLGLALLQGSLALFQRRGFQNAELAVDAASLTNAVALYERAGMYVQQRRLSYSKVLRGTVEA